MSVDVVRDGASENVLVTKTVPVVTTGQRNASNDLIIGIGVGVLCLVILLLICVCFCKRRRRAKNIRYGPELSSISTGASTSAIYSIPVDPGVLRTPQDVARRYERSVSSLSVKSQVYLVPFSALPPDFDYSSREVEVKGDFVILKDLSFLEKYKNSPTDGGVVNEAYERQESYNPLFGVRSPRVGESNNQFIYGSIPPLEREGYKKQAPYNPTFY